MLYCVRFVLQKFFPASATDHHAETRFSCVDQLCGMYDALERWGDGDAETARMCGTRCLMAYSELYQASLENREWQSTGFMLWRVYPKFHLLQHILEDQMRAEGNARESWCYPDESEIGAAVCVAELSHPSTLHRLVLQKHRLEPSD